MVTAETVLRVKTVPARAADLDRYLPADAEQVAVANVRQMLDSPLVQKHGLDHLKAALQKDKKVQDLLTALKLDPLKDIDTVIVANAGTRGDKTLLVVEGRFDQKKIDDTFAQLAPNSSSRRRAMRSARVSTRFTCCDDTSRMRAVTLS